MSENKLDAIKRITLAGFGGQGVMMIGQLLAYAGNEENLNALWYPSYGPETRGGTANCSVIISRSPVNSPVFSKSDVLIALNKPSLVKFIDMVDKNGIVLYNSSLIDEIPATDVKTYGVPINDLANQLGNPKVANIIMLGAYIGYANTFKTETIKKVLKDYLGSAKASLLDINMEAFEIGRSFISEKLK